MKLHLGCNRRYIPGFTHIDMADFPHIDYRCNVRHLPMFEDNSAELVYASHVLEYFDRQEGLDALREWRRVLKPGGVLRVAVLDLEALADVYCECRDISLLLGPLFGRMLIKTSDGEIAIYHKTCYDREDLTFILGFAGFDDVRHWDWRTTEHAEVDDFSQAYWPHMDKENGRLMSLNLEATK